MFTPQVVPSKPFLGGCGDLTNHVHLPGRDEGLDGHA
jgi:hypothetical protein